MQTALKKKVHRVRGRAIHQPQLDNHVHDIRFQKLLTEAEWAALPADTQRRFSKRVTDGKAVVYIGRLTEMVMNSAGRCLAHVLRLIGAPLPICEDIDVPSVVSVTEDVATGGQVWTRMYANNKTFPQVIHSAKRFSGPTGLEEYVGFGIAMALNVRVEEGVLYFESEGYYLRLGERRLRLPAFMTPGALTVTHADFGEGTFDFGLTLKHKLFGTLLNQIGRYREEGAAA